MTTRCEIYSIPDSVSQYDSNGMFIGEYYLDPYGTKKELTDIAITHSHGMLQRGDLILFHIDGGYRQKSAFVWDGVSPVPFNCSGDYPTFPSEAGISIDEFSTVLYYSDANLYNNIVWLDTSGYTLESVDGKKKIIVNSEKHKRYEIESTTEDITELEFRGMTPFGITSDTDEDFIIRDRS